MHQRSHCGIHIVPLFKKNTCQMCGATDNIELHHGYSFDRLLYETLDELGLPLKDTKRYSDTELRLITNLMLGKQVKIKYQTLCSKCHDLTHTLVPILHDYKFKGSPTPLEKVIKRKPINGKSQTDLQKIVSWHSERPEGFIFKRAYLLKQLGITADRYKKIMKYEHMSNLFAKTSKKGYYQIKKTEERNENMDYAKRNG